MSEPPPPATKPDDQPIEAGKVGEIKDLPFHEAQHRAETARSLATWSSGQTARASRTALAGRSSKRSGPCARNIPASPSDTGLWWT